MDITIKVGMKQSEINGLFNEIEEFKRKRSHLTAGINQKTETIIDYILNNGNVLAYKDNEAHVLTVTNGSSRKFDKSKLADDVARSQSELNVIGIAELVETKKLTTEQLNGYFYDEPTQRLKARKAKKSDIELLTGGGRG